jgi:uncharacterized protein YndB with AHSA1/START domain
MNKWTEEPVVKEVSLNAPVSKVWKAITEKEEMKKWYFDLTEFRAEKGFKFQFYGGDEKKQWLHLCEVTEVIPERKLSYSWKYDGYPGNSHVTFELFPEADKTRLRLTHTVGESFPDEIPEFNRENFVAGWEYIIGKSIKDYIEKED